MASSAVQYMIIYECIKIFDKNMCLCLLLLSNNKYNMPFESIFWHIDWIFFLVFITKTLMPIQFFFSISWISLILTWDFVFKSSSLAESLSTFLALAGWWSARYKHTIRHQLKHSFIIDILNINQVFFGWFDSFGNLI